MLKVHLPRGDQPCQDRGKKDEDNRDQNTALTIFFTNEIYYALSLGTSARCKRTRCAVPQ